MYIVGVIETDYCVDNTTKVHNICKASLLKMLKHLPPFNSMIYNFSDRVHDKHYI
jgi:hypothetical protein